LSFSSLLELTLDYRLNTDSHDDLEGIEAFFVVATLRLIQ